MSTRDSWQLTMRKSTFVHFVDVSTYIYLGIMKEQVTRRLLRSCIKTSTVAGFAASVVPNLTSLTRTTTPKLGNEGSGKSLPR